MIQCPYPYCRAVREEPASVCPRCGHPADPAALKTPAFFLGAMARLQGLPAGMLDLHQILPRYPGIERIQLLAMDQLGIQRALLQSAPDQATSLQGDDGVAALAAAHPDRFWASAFVDPRAPDALDRLERARGRGVRVIKLLPVTGWRASDDALRPFWARMEALELLAMVHTGFFTARHKAEEAAAGAFMDSSLGDPLQFDRPCREFPALRVLLCHAGGALWFEQAAEMVSQHEHVWADVAASGLFALQRLIRGDVAVDWTKLVWGNDSAPPAYPLNLALFLGATAERPELREPLLAGNGARLAAAYLDA